VAISNARITKCTDTDVSFTWRNRKENYKPETETISGEEFIKRFSEHIVPAYFRRIRHLGFFSTRNTKTDLNCIRESLKIEAKDVQPLSRAQVLELRFGERSALKCRECGGHLELLEFFPNQRAPPRQES